MTTRRRSARGRPSPHIRPNRRGWDRNSAWYERHNRRDLGRSGGAAWGLWRIPERRAHWLGSVRGRRILELGCGAARWSLALRRQGADAVGIDLSAEQLRAARDVTARAGVRLPLVRGDAERLPFEDEVFDLVFCDWGALTFSDPRRTIPECARVMRAGADLVFATGSPFGLVSWDPRTDRLTRRLLRPYFGPMRRVVGNLVEFRPTVSEWLELFQDNQLTVDRFSESRGSPRFRSSYITRRDMEWAARWPLEYIWRARKGPLPRPRRRAA